MKRAVITSLYLLGVVTTITAQVMNLDQCIRFALENNLSYANMNIEATINNELYQQSKRDFLPEVYGGSSANKRYGRSIDPTTNTFVNQDFFSMNFYIDSQMELFRGFTRLNSIKFQKLQYLVSREEMKQKEIEIAFAVMNQYYDLLYFTNLQEIVQEQVELTTLNVEKTKKLIELGLKAESDLLEMKAQQATEMHNLTLAKNQRDLAMLSLKNLMNWPIDEVLQPVNEEMLSAANRLPAPDAIYESALQHMPSIQQAGYNVEAMNKQLAIARGDLLPRLALGAGIYTNYADSRLESLYPNDPGNNATRIVPFQDQWSQNMAQSIYVSLQIPIFNRWNGMSRVKQAKWNKTMAINRQKEEQQNLYRLVNEDMQQLQSLQDEREQIQVKREALREAYSIAEKKLEQGLIGTIEFYTAKNQLAQAETDWVRASLQLKIKEKTIRFYLGEALF